MVLDESTLLQFWGKAQPVGDEGPSHHPLVYHSLDVAAVGEALLTAKNGPASRLFELFDWPRRDVIQTICLLLSLHDIGKFAKRFQAKVPSLFPDCFDDELARLGSRYDHGAGGLRLFDADPNQFGLPGHSRNWRPLVSAVTGHHGAPPVPTANEGLRGLRGDFGKAGIDAAGTFIGSMRALFFPSKAPPSLKKAGMRAASYAVGGLAVLADWIGSNQEWFPYKERDKDLLSYFNKARYCATRAVGQAGVIPSPSSDGLDYGQLIGKEAAASPMQRWAECADLPAGPALFLIEDETGSGKTEAALMLAHRLMADGRANGLHIALPTMATANAMFDRMAKAHRHLFARGSQPSVALAHGARHMHEGFQDAMLRGGRRESPYSEGSDGDTTASAACAAWIADDRRRAFLADVGAGTVDQAILAVLPSRFQSLRLLGLMHRVLILDEVHAYDAYMQREIERLLEFQAGLGGSAILLSATLPVSIRRRLAGAFERGLGGNVADVSDSGEYPITTICSREKSSTVGVPGRADRGRRLPARFLRSVDEALLEVEREAAAGKAVLYIRNTVDDALDAYRALTARGLCTDLFHARFALCDRLEIEKRIVSTFGKNSLSGEREGRVLVATQVVEQSLDLDFDAMVTDLAPIDLVIQRAGRLWRHKRADRAGHPELIVVGPEAGSDDDETWFSGFFPRAAYVYKDHARLWLTARTLEEVGCIESPGDLRRLIESVYGEDADTRLPEALKCLWWEAEGNAGAERSVATGNLLDLTKGYVRDGGAWDNDLITPTRLGDDPQTTLRLGVLRDGRILPYGGRIEASEPWRAWRLSEVNVSARKVGTEAVSPELAGAFRLAKADWNVNIERGKLLVVLRNRENGSGTLTGTVMSAGDSPAEVSLNYNSRVGLKFV